MPVFAADRYPAEINQVLDSAGENRGELEAVLEHFRGGSDSLKYQAALYLIGNMEGHGYVTYDLVDTAGQVVEFSIFDYPTYDSLLVVLRQIETERGELDYKRREMALDVNTISSEFLVSQIEYAFKAWREKPWARGFSFEQFCEYILPYRGSNEPLEDWRSPLWNRYGDLQSRMTDSTDAFEAARIVNEDVRSWFGFDARYYLHPTDQGFQEMVEQRLGRCEDMTNITIYACRAVGLGVTSDYTPFWANSGNNHAWNAIVSVDGKVVPFMGAEANPGEYALANKVGKVYRKSFAQKKGNLAFQEHKQEKVPGWLAGKTYVDVTRDYTATVEVTVKLANVPDSVDIAYLCVFNSGSWEPIHWGRVVNDTVTFTDMGTGVMYLPAYYLNEKVVPAGRPLVTREDGFVTFACDRGLPGTVTAMSTTRRTLEVSTDGVERSALTPGVEYELFVWEGEDWQSLGKATSGEQPLEFADVPSGGVYWLVATGSDREERIFTVEDGRQVWW